LERPIQSLGPRTLSAEPPDIKVYLLVKGHFVYPAIDNLPAREAPGRALGFTDDDV
jgi:hypothetical protein